MDKYTKNKNMLAIAVDGALSKAKNLEAVLDAFVANGQTGKPKDQKTLWEKIDGLFIPQIAGGAILSSGIYSIAYAAALNGKLSGMAAILKALKIIGSMVGFGAVGGLFVIVGVGALAALAGVKVKEVQMAAKETLDEHFSEVTLDADLKFVRTVIGELTELKARMSHVSSLNYMQCAAVKLKISNLFAVNGRGGFARGMSSIRNLYMSTGTLKDIKDIGYMADHKFYNGKLSVEKQFDEIVNTLMSETIQIDTEDFFNLGSNKAFILGTLARTHTIADMKVYGLNVLYGDSCLLEQRLNEMTDAELKTWIGTTSGIDTVSAGILEFASLEDEDDEVDE